MGKFLKRELKLDDFDDQLSVVQSLSEDGVVPTELDKTVPSRMADMPGDIETEFAFKLINSVKSVNLGEIDYHEMIESFTLADELKCLFLFVKALPYAPIKPLYPEEPFLLFKGVHMPRAFDLSEETAVAIGSYMKDLNSVQYSELRLHDLDQRYLDAYERAIRIYNDMVDKSRSSYHEQVKNARSQVIEVSAAVICSVILMVAIVGIF